jgi:hypothetical protein
MTAGWAARAVPTATDGRSTAEVGAEVAVRVVQQFLGRFGYLAAGGFEPGVMDDATTSALCRYQARNGLAVSGALDGATRRKLSRPRCGVPDPERAGFAVRCAWVHPCLTFAFDTGTNDVPGGAEFQAVRDALATWAAAAPLTFTEVGLGQHPDIVVGWRPADDPDFALSGTIAHADFPPGCGVIGDTLPKPVHFNDPEINWVIGKVIFSFDVQSVALHELGHVLGLEHSDVEDAVMAPTLSFNATRRSLAADDVAGLHQLYPAGIPRGVVTIRQAGTGRMLDAHEVETEDFRLVTRPDQDNDTQRWILDPVGTVYVIRHKTSGRFLDAYQSGFEGNTDFRVMTRDPGRDDDSQRWIVVPAGDGSVTIRQLSTNRFIDAHEIAAEDFAAVTRPAQTDETQRWVLTPRAANTFTLTQRSSGRLLDAHEIAAKDFRVVTRPAQGDETQHWIFAPVGTVCTVRQRSNGRFVDAYEIAAEDFAVVTRTFRVDDTRRWIVLPSRDGSCSIRQLSNGRRLDAYRDGDHDFGVVTRLSTNPASQRWLVQQV